MSADRVKCHLCGGRIPDGYQHICTLPDIRLPNLSACSRCGAITMHPDWHDDWHAALDGAE